MKNYLIQFFFIFSFFNGYAQGGSIGGANDPNGPINLNTSGNHHLSQQLMDDAFNGRYSDNASYSKIDGNAFLTEEPVKGTLILNNGTEIKDIPVQMDLYKQEIIITDKGGEKLYLNKKHYKQIILHMDKKDMIFERINPKEPDTFYEILHREDKLILFKEWYVTIKEAVKNGMSNVPSRFTERKNYYLLKGKKNIQKVKLKKKKFFEYIPRSRSKAMAKHAKENGFKLKKEKHFIAALKGTQQ